jgi:hypothetical protein
MSGEEKAISRRFDMNFIFTYLQLQFAIGIMVVVIILEWLLQLNVQSVSINNKVVSSGGAHREAYSM